MLASPFEQLLSHGLSRSEVRADHRLRVALLAQVLRRLVVVQLRQFHDAEQVHHEALVVLVERRRLWFERQHSSERR